MAYLKQTLNNLIQFLLIVTVLSCQQDKKPMRLTGHVVNANQPFILLINGVQSDTIKLDTNGRFVYEPPTTNNRFVGLMVERSMLNVVYLYPGTDVILEVNAKTLKNRNLNSIKISGVGSDESNFLLHQAKASTNNNPNYKFNTRKLMTSSPQIFEKLHQEQYNYNIAKLDSFLTENPNSGAFISDLKILENIERERRLDIYPRMYKMFTKDTVPITYTFKKFGEEIPLDNENLYKSNITYSTYVDRYHTAKFRNKYPNEDPDRESVTAVLDYYVSNAANAVVTRKINYLINRYINLPEADRALLKSEYRKYISDSTELNKAHKIIADTERLAKGSIAPDFKYPDINGKMISLSDFKGKYVYIDLWATWCLPCIAEIPALKELEEEFKEENIVFLSVAIKDKKTRWEKMIKDKQLGGIQLYSGATLEASINKDYVINTIPRFMIIDKEGKIITAFATKPSNPETRKMLQQLIAN